MIGKTRSLLMKCLKKIKQNANFILKKGLLAGCMAALLFTTFFEGSTVKAAEKKHIHIVFDNSISMVAKGNGEAAEDLAEATYALQVLLGMLNEEDEAVIYLLNEYEEIWKAKSENVSGAQKRKLWENQIEALESTCEQNDKVEIIDRSIMKTGDQLRDKIKTDIVGDLANLAGNTYFFTAMNALKELLNEEENCEKWLVILSDGEYEDWDGEDEAGIAENVNMYLSDEKYSDINIIHYSFNLTQYNKYQNENENITYYSNGGTNNGNQMLDSMIQIGNQIFGRKEVKAQSTDEGYKINLETSASKLIIFGQNSQEETSKMSIGFSDADKYVTSTLDVETILEMKNSNPEKYTYITGSCYMGEILTYDFSSENNKNWLSAGTHTIAAENVSRLRVYYEPEIELGLVFENAKTGDEVYITPSDDKTKLLSGQYKVTAKLYDPLKLESGDAKEAVIENFSIAPLLNVDGTEATIEWSGELLPGEHTITIDTEIYTGLTKNEQIKINVIDSLDEIEAQLIVPKDGINIQNLKEEGNYLEIIIENRGETLSKEVKAAAKVTHVNKEDSLYNYQVEETETGWRLCPQKKWRSDESDLSGTMKETFAITFDIEGVEVEPIELSAEVLYHGNPFSVEFETSWGKSIGIIDWFFPLRIEAQIDGKNIDWDQVTIKDVSPSFWDEENGVFKVKLSENERYWELMKNISWIDILKSLEYGSATQELTLAITLERYEKEETISQDIKIKMDIGIMDIIITIITVLTIVYVVVLAISKVIRGINLWGLKGQIEYSKDPLNNLPIKIKKCRLYNLFAFGSSKFKVYLNEITNGENQKIVFKCKAKGICTIQNLGECQAFSQIRVNGFVAKESSMYDLEQKLRIAIERDPEKTIIVYKK